MVSKDNLQEFGSNSEIQSNFDKIDSRGPSEPFLTVTSWSGLTGIVHLVSYSPIKRLHRLHFDVSTLDPYTSPPLVLEVIVNLGCKE